MWLGDWFLIEKKHENHFSAVHKYYFKDDTYEEQHVQNITIFDNNNNLFGYTKKDHDRFWSKIKAPENELEDCWEWTAGLTVDGYGQFKIVTDRSPIGHHRVSYQMFFGPIPKCFVPGLKYLEVMHSCNNRLCCSPYHLSLGDSRMNGKYMVESKRSLTNELNPTCKHSNEIILEIFDKVQDGKLTSVKEIMSTYTMTFQEVHALFDGRIRGTLTEKYDLRKLKQKICRLNLITEEVLQIRQLIVDGVQTSTIAAMFNRPKRCIDDIKNNKSYTTV